MEEGGGGVQRGGGISLKSEEKGGKKGEAGVDAGKWSGAFLGGEGSLIFILRVEEPNGPNTVSGSTVSNTELSEFFWAH